jgi:hypothetical protein
MTYDIKLRNLVPAHLALATAIREAFPDESDGDLIDTIAGESDLPDAIVAVLRAALEREAQAKAIKDELIARLTERARRLEDGAKSLRAAALQAMTEANLSSVKSIDMTISVGRGKGKVQITEPDLIPAALCRIIKEPNKAKIGKLLTSGTNVPGATLGNATPFLTVHRS